MSKAQLYDQIEDLIAACEAEMIGDTCIDEPDNAHVAYFMTFGSVTPPGVITFGKIRRARAALDELKAGFIDSPAFVKAKPTDPQQHIV